MKYFALMLLPFLAACSSVRVSVPFFADDKTDIVVAPWFDLDNGNYQYGIQVFWIKF